MRKLLFILSVLIGHFSCFEFTEFTAEDLAIINSEPPALEPSVEYHSVIYLVTTCRSQAKCSSMMESLLNKALSD
jgi:hypothetical protein